MSDLPRRARHRAAHPPHEWLTGVGIACLTVGLGVVVTFALVLGPLAPVTANAVEAGLELPADGEFDPLAQRSVVYAADGSVLGVLHDEVDRKVVTLQEIPEHAQQAVIAAEDRRFYSHDGYDLEGITRALIANVQAGAVAQGGSTITQQLAKANFTGAEQTLDRKVNELLYAVALEQRFSKPQLLERYLNEVYFGSGAYGIAAAAEEFFGVTPAELTVEQSALLAGVIRSPERLNPRRDAQAAKGRRDAILMAMVDEGHIDAVTAGELSATPVSVLPQHEPVVKEPYVIEAVKREFFANEAFGASREERIERLFTAGLQIHTTIDPRLQEAAAAVVGEAFSAEDEPTAAIAAVDPRLGRVLAVYSGAEFTEEQFDLATQGRRQPGSSFKPFVLAAALEAGFPPELTLEGSTPLVIDEPGMIEPWEVENFDGTSFGPLDLEDALVNSVNTAFAQLILAVGVDEVIDVATRLGIDGERGVGSDIGPAIALGGLEFGVTPLEMASAFGAFANTGIHVRPALIERVVDADANVLFEREPQATQAVQPAVADTLVEYMQQVVRRGTGTAAALRGWQAAGKTGTTQNHADAWFVGYTPVISTAVWVGHPDAQVPMRGVTGGSLPARLWRAFMAAALDGVEAVEFPETDASIDDLASDHEADVPDVRGMDEADALGALTQVALIGNVQDVDATAPAGSVVWQNPRPGTTVNAGTRVTIGVSTGRAPPPSPEPTEPAPGETPVPEGEEGEPAPPPPSEPADDSSGATDGEEAAASTTPTPSGSEPAPSESEPPAGEDG